jgi:hypothetical protein
VAMGAVAMGAGGGGGGGTKGATRTGFGLT